MCAWGWEEEAGRDGLSSSTTPSFEGAKEFPAVDFNFEEVEEVLNSSPVGMERGQCSQRMTGIVCSW